MFWAQLWCKWPNQNTPREERWIQRIMKLKKLNRKFSKTCCQTNYILFMKIKCIAVFKFCLVWNCALLLINEVQLIFWSTRPHVHWHFRANIIHWRGLGYEWSMQFSSYTYLDWQNLIAVHMLTLVTDDFWISYGYS